MVIFCFIGFNVWNKNIMISDGVFYNFVNKYLINDNMTPFVMLITQLGDVLCIIVITILSLFVVRKKKINFSIIINLIIVTVLNVFLKLIFVRPRPDFGVLVEETGYSFPSGHSMISMAFYGYFVYLIYNHIRNRKVKVILISIISIIILLIGISRVYLGVHYITDVIGGFCFSVAYLIIYTSIINKIIK